MSTFKGAVLKTLGRGGEGEALLATDPIWGKSLRELPNISNETNTAVWMKDLPQCANLAAVFDQELTRLEGRLYVEYCDGGDLTHILRNMIGSGWSTSPSFVRHVMVHLGAALVYLHTGCGWHSDSGKFTKPLRSNWNKISHRDIKPDNILIRMSGKIDRSSPYPDILFSDFGMAAMGRPFTSPWKGNEHVISPQWTGFCDPDYAPPEHTDNGWHIDGPKPYYDTKKISLRGSYNIWQLGSIIYELNTGRELRETIQTKGKSRQYDYLNCGYGSINNDIRSMTRDNYKDRMTDAELKGNIPYWKKSRDRLWNVENHHWFDRAFGSLLQTALPPPTTRRGDGVRLKATESAPTKKKGWYGSLF